MEPQTTIPSPEQQQLAQRKREACRQLAAEIEKLEHQIAGLSARKVQLEERVTVLKEAADTAEDAVKRDRANSEASKVTVEIERLAATIEAQGTRLTEIQNQYRFDGCEAVL